MPGIAFREQYDVIKTYLFPNFKREIAGAGSELPERRSVYRSVMKKRRVCIPFYRFLGKSVPPGVPPQGGETPEAAPGADFRLPAFFDSHRLHTG